MATGKGFGLGTSFTTKAIMIGINLAMLSFSLINWGVFATLQQLTNWVLILETVHLCVSLKCTTDPAIGNKAGWLTLHHLTFEVMCPFNFIVTTVYWTILRESVLLRC